MDIAFYFSPPEFEEDSLLDGHLGKKVVFSNGKNIDDWDESLGFVILGVNEDRGAINNEGCAYAPDIIRKHLYRLYSPAYFKVPILDLGNILEGESIEDSYYALSSVCSYLLKRNKIPIILGGSHDLTYAQYLAYESLEQVINLATIDRKFDMGEALMSPLNAETFLSKILLHQPNYLFNYANIGHQSYFVADDVLQLIDKLYFDFERLGQIKEDIKRCEPIIRNIDALSFDVSAIKRSDAPGTFNATPNGLNGEEACAICRYAGISDKVSSFGIYEYNPAADIEEQTAQLIAQMIWYFIEGVNQRKGDIPSDNNPNYLRYRVAVSNHAEDILFYKSIKSDRWWMKVPYPNAKANEYKRHHMVPCSYSDYTQACSDEIPDLWLRTFRKFL